jgi:NAD(P)-dependent dehydrogenase (short-subunit alcohol dehydrogenase family)
MLGSTPKTERRRSEDRQAEGKIALITAGNNGIRLATPKRFVNEAANVFITRRREAELAVATREIEKKCHRRARKRV